MKDSPYELALSLREKLHGIPEASGREVKTKAALMEFLSGFGLELICHEKWFAAAHREPGAKQSIAFRADMDAVTGTDGKPYHGCGHDGHCSVMAALAASTAGKRLGKNLFFLFQHAEETGEGAKECLRLFEEEHIDAIYGFHNCPGFPAGEVLLLKDTFACASKGITLQFSGTQTHAAYPENGNNPIFPMSAFFTRWDALTESAQYQGLVLATPVCFQAGTPAFGVAAGRGQICLTLRAWYDTDLQELERAVLDSAAALAAKAGIGFSWQEQDVFPATRNDPGLLAGCEKAAKEAGLSVSCPSEPFRWSEDFGWYGSKVPALLLGIGTGENAPGLHTPQYCWNNAVTEAALKLFGTIIIR